MHYWKFSFLMFLSLNLYGFEAFNDNKCLDQEANTLITHSVLPFDLKPITLSIDKKNCEILISRKDWYFLKQTWFIDICREPIHIKSKRAGEVFKKNMPCTVVSTEEQKSAPKNEFCELWSELKQTLLNDGLIYAEGEKENLGSDHGKNFCAYLLLKKYLGEDTVFNRLQNYTGTLLPEAERTIEKEEEIVEEVLPQGKRDLRPEPPEQKPLIKEL